jgi:molybdopterin/thiamine biosynthesis adenylyltransferase
MNLERYSRQMLFSGIGEKGQQLIGQATLLIVGCGALGTVAADHLARAGVGKLIIADRDFVELSNLQRQVLFDEKDAAERLPKAVAAREKLSKINSGIEVEACIMDVNASNIESLVIRADLVLDATDNMEARYLINDACVKNRVPWVYGGAVGSSGMTMTIIPGKTTCLRCLMRTPPAPGTLQTCDVSGVLNSAPGVVASIQAAEALKIIVGNERCGNTLVHIDIWERDFGVLRPERDPDCPACGHGKFDFLDGHYQMDVFSLCGRNAVQISPGEDIDFDLGKLTKRLEPIGRVTDNGYFLTFEVDEYELVIFPEGRTLIKGTTDESVARGLFAKYIGV